MFQVPVYKEPEFTIPGTPGIVQHEILNNRRHVLTKVLIIILHKFFSFSFQFSLSHVFEILCSGECNVLFHLAGFCWLSKALGDHQRHYGGGLWEGLIKSLSSDCFSFFSWNDVNFSVLLVQASIGFQYYCWKILLRHDTFLLATGMLLIMLILLVCNFRSPSTKKRKNYSRW